MRGLCKYQVLFIMTLFFLPSLFAEDTVPVEGSTPLVIPLSKNVNDQNLTISTIGSQIGELLQKIPSSSMPQSFETVQKIRQNYEDFFAAKDSCAKKAEEAETLCIESKSPSAQKAKGIVARAGPILASISSAQKACSSTADMASSAGEAVSAAKSACAGAKTMCDISCSTANKSLENFMALSKDFVNVANIEIAKGRAEMQYQFYLIEAEFAVNKYNAAYPKTIGTEKNATPLGTTASLVGRCQDYARDVDLFARSLGNLLAANQSAKDCAAKLGTNSGSPTSMAQYCELPANSSTSICVCQRDNNAAGCPGSIGKNSGADKLKDETGKNIKNAAGANQFAGGFDPVTSQAIDLGKLKSDANPNSDSSIKDSAKNDGGIGAAPGGGPGSSLGSGGGGAGASSKDAAVDPENKKNFGTFGAAGGSGSSSGKAGSSSAGALGKKEMDGIQRAIASEKLRAEVSGPNGKSNWEKVTTQYLQKSPSLLSGQ